LNGVEVRASSGAWIPKAQILNYDPNQERVTIEFKDQENSCQDVALGDVRFESVCPPQELSLQEGDDVEVMWKNKGDAPTQWYTAKVRNVKGGFFVCEFVHFGQAVSDVFDGECVRAPNPNACLSGTDFFKVEVDIPQALQPYCAAHAHAHRDFQKACEAMSVSYIDGRLIILSQKNISRRVEMIKEFHINNLSQKMKLAERLTEVQEKLEQSKLVAESSCEKFKVDPELIKFVVGSKGSNIQKARGITGVLDVRIDDENHTVSIYAETPEAAKQARTLLEYTEEHYLVPRNLTSRIIGQKGKSIQDIIDKSQVLKVRVLSEEDARSIPGADSADVCCFKFIGTLVNNQNAKALMDYLVQSLKEIDVMQYEQKEIEQQIGNYNIYGSTFSINGQNSSGYSSDNKESNYKGKRARKGENGDAESDINRKGNQKNRSQKSRENRIEDSYQDQQSKQKNLLKIENLDYANLEEYTAVKTDSDDWSEVAPQQKKSGGMSV